MLDRYRRACAANDKQACHDAARIAYSWVPSVFIGDTVPDLRIGCDLGDARACETAAMRMDEHANPDGYFAITLRACDLGNAGGCSDHGYAFEHGLGTKQDLVEALVFYTKGCAGKNLLSCANAGFASEHVKPPDYAAAASFFDRACPSGLKDRDEDLCAKAAAFYQRHPKP